MSLNNSVKKAMVVITVLVCASALLLWIAVEWHLNSTSTQETSTQETRSRPATSITSEVDANHEAVYTSAVANSFTKSTPISNDSQQIPSTLQYYLSRIFSKPSVDMDSENFTIVVMTYKRANILPKVLSHYCKTPRLQGIVVIWNNLQKPVPENLWNLSCEVPLKFIQETENRMTNRFKPRPEIETECVVIIDDDRFFTKLTDITFGFTVWQQFRHRIVGFEHRTHTELPNGQYHYGVKTQYKYQGYSLMVGATLILHKAYLEMFQDPKVLPRAMFEYIDKLMNCDDIGICLMVAKFLKDVSRPQCAVLPVAYAAIWNLEAQASEGFRGLSQRSNHYDQRTECLNKFTEFYSNPLPLIYENKAVHAHTTQ